MRERTREEERKKKKEKTKSKNECVLTELLRLLAVADPEVHNKE